MTRQYVIWSIEHQAWWPASRMGYVLTLAEAGRFSHAEATAIVATANYPPGTCHECMIPVDAVGAAGSRLSLLAREAAWRRHHAARDDYSTDEWTRHTIDVDTCPHPDCLLVREGEG